MNRLLTTLAGIAILLLSCKKDKDEQPPTVPTLTTAAVTNIVGSTAQSGGDISTDGGATITASGICWSKTNNLPTITDDSTKGTTSSGTFTATLKNIEPSATYYVRAYATNSAGTGYGNVVTFNTGNAAPQALNIVIVGTAALTSKIKGTYTFSDFENDAKATAGYQWYIATDTAGGATGTAISGATDSIYTIASGDQNKYLRVVITPKAAAGTTDGAATNSWWVGPVGPEPTSVTFTYNGASVTYGILTSPTTGKKWLDRNLGASRVATASDDYLAYGDLFQWGRPADGHQLMTWTNSTTGTAVNGTTATLATSDMPGHNLFIQNDPNTADWRSDNNQNRWRSNPQGPCPFGWHVPTYQEWDAEQKWENGAYQGISNAATAFSMLKLTKPGARNRGDGSLYTIGIIGNYWGSSIMYSSPTTFWIMDTQASRDFMTNYASGQSVRCIKD